MSTADDEVRRVCAQINGLMDGLDGNVAAMLALLTADPDPDPDLDADAEARQK